jgi:hypothetical protein
MEEVADGVVEVLLNKNCTDGFKWTGVMLAITTRDLGSPLP